MRTVEFANGEYYHLYNRGVDKRNIFMCDDDFWRFYVSIFLLNDLNFRSPKGISSLPGYKYVRNPVTNFVKTEDRKPFVDIVSFVLMPNHFHFFARQLTDGGISQFLFRLTKGYSRYFNIKNSRSGALFEGSFKAVHIARESYFLHLPRYIHLNVFDLVEPGWREHGINDWGKANAFLDQYPWSSHAVYQGRTQQLEVVNSICVRDIFKTSKDYMAFLEGWAKKDFLTVRDCAFE